MMKNHVIEYENICKIYEKQYALKNVSFQIKKGGIYGLIGPNGAGKTTIMKIMAGIINPTSGKMKIMGKSELEAVISERKKMSFIIENPYTFSDMTAYENLYFQLINRNITNKSIIKKNLEYVGLSDVGDKKVSKFSLGMRQRLGIAMALIGDVDVIVLDEPTNGLDPEGIIELRKMILELNKDRGITFIISSHNLEELSRIADHYIFVKNGQIINTSDIQTIEQACSVKYTMVTSDMKKTENILSGFLGDGTYKVIDGKIRIDTSLDIPSLSKQLYDNRIYIYELYESTISLEQYYMDIYGGKVI